MKEGCRGCAPDGDRVLHSRPGAWDTGPAALAQATSRLARPGEPVSCEDLIAYPVGLDLGTCTRADRERGHQ